MRSRVRVLVAPLVLRPARRDLLRFALTVSGIAVGVATIAAIRLANASVLRSFSSTVDLVAGKASLTVLADGPGIPEETLERLAWLREAGAMLAPALSETVALAGRGAGEIVEVLGIDPVSDPAVREWRTEGAGAPTEEASPRGPGGAGGGAPPPNSATGAPALPAGIFGPDAVLVPRDLARRLRLRVGDPLPLVAGGVERRMTVAGILAPEGAARAASGGLLFADLATVQESFRRAGRLDRIDVVLPPGTPPEGARRFEEEIRASLPPGTTVGRPERRAETVDRMVRAFRVNLSALGLIALLVGVYFVYNTLAISVLRRRADIGTVRALGAPASAVFGAFLLEGAALGVLGSGLGLLLGIALAKTALAAIGGTVTQFYLPSARPTFSADPAVLLFAFGAGLLASILAALAPALEAARVPPAAAMRHGSIEAVRRRSAGPLTVVGFVLLALGAAATRPGPVNGLPLWGFVSVFLLVAGSTLLAPAAVLLASRLGSTRAARRLGVPLRIARANLHGSLSRTAVAVAALTMAIGMMVSVAVMVGSFRSTVSRWVEETLKSDLFVSPASGRTDVSIGRLPEEALALVRGVPGVAAVDPYLGFAATRDGAPFVIGSGLFSYLAERGSLPLVDGRDVCAVAREALARDQVFVSEPYAEKFHARAGDTVELPTDRGPVRLTIAAVYTDYSNDRGSIVLDRALFQRIYGLKGAASLAVSLEPGITPEEGKRRIEAASRERFALRIRTNGTLRREVLRIFDRTFAVTYALEAVAIAVAVLGVFNTLVALVLERRREIGLLRVLGASAAVVKAAVRIEAAAIGGLGAVLGLLAGGAMSLVLVHVINRQSFGWTIRTDWPLGFLSGSIGLVLVTTLLAAHHPARLAAATDAAEVLKETG